MEPLKISYYGSKEETMSVRVFNVGYEQCRPGFQWGLGQKDIFLLHYVVSGKGSYRVDGATYSLAEGDLFLIYPGVEISYQADQEEPWSYYWVGFQGNDARVILEMTDFTNDHPIMKTEGMKDVQDKIMRIYEARGNQYSNKIEMSGYLMVLLSRLIAASTKKQSLGRYHGYIELALEYIQYNYGRPITVEEVAAYIGISRSHLFRAFEEAFLRSPVQFIQEYKIQRACSLLSDSQLSIASIAYSVGYEDSLYFSRVFHKITGQSPSEYRKKEGTNHKLK